jgi:hypothetical protein
MRRDNKFAIGLLLLWLLVFTVACSKPKLRKYVERINYNENPPYEIDSMTALNDTQAYSMAIKHCYEEIEANKNDTNLRVTSFYIKNMAGINLEQTVPPKVKDSINRYWKGHYSKSLH